LDLEAAQGEADGRLRRRRARSHGRQADPPQEAALPPGPAAAVPPAARQAVRGRQGAAGSGLNWRALGADKASPCQSPTAVIPESAAALIRDPLGVLHKRMNGSRLSASLRPG